MSGNTVEFPAQTSSLCCCFSPSRRCLWSSWKSSRTRPFLPPSFWSMTSSLWALHLPEEQAVVFPALLQVNKHQRFFASLWDVAFLWCQTHCFNFCPHRSCSSWKETQRVQSFPGPALRRCAPGGSSHLRWPPADEAHLRLPAHIHARAGVGRGQRRSRAQRLVESVTGGLNETSPDRNKPPFYFTSSALQEDLLSHSTTPFLCNNLPLHRRVLPTSPQSVKQTRVVETFPFSMLSLTYSELCPLLSLYPSDQNTSDLADLVRVSGVDHSLSVHCFDPFLLWFLRLVCLFILRSVVADLGHVVPYVC